VKNDTAYSTDLFGIFKFTQKSTLPMVNINKLRSFSPGASYTDRPQLVGKLVPTFVDRVCHVVSVTDPYGRIIGFLGRNRYFFFQAAPQLHSPG
jgi:hypothetical protein